MNFYKLGRYFSAKTTLQQQVYYPTLSDTIKKRITSLSASQLFFCACILHFLLWVLLPYFIRPQILIDSAEGIAWGMQWELGYFKHPFLAPWISIIFVKILGNIDLAVYFVSQLSVIVCFVAIWRLANKILSPLQALVAVFLLEANFYYHIIALQFNPNILMLPLWALSALFFYNAITQSKVLWWLLLGICLGLALDTKYETPLLIISMLLFIFMDQQGRQSLKSWGPYITVLISSIIFLPNLIWMFNHKLAPIHYALNSLNETHLPANFIRARLVVVSTFITTQLGNILPILLLLIPFYLRINIKERLINKFHWKFMVIVGFGPLFLALLYALLTASQIKPYWSYPFYSLLGLILVAYLNPKVNKYNLYWFYTILFSLQLVILLLFKGYINSSNAEQNNFPFKAMAYQETQRWHKRYHTPLPNILGSRSIASYMTTYSQDHPKPYFMISNTQSPWINDHTIEKVGGLFMWTDEESYLYTKVKQRFPNLINCKPTTYNALHVHHQKNYTVHCAVIPPKSRLIKKALFNN